VGTANRIYLDFNASTPLAPEVVAAMTPYLTEEFGNPSSTHWAGAAARDAVEAARLKVAMLIGCDPTEVVFTSGGTEADNYALLGAFFSARDRIKRPHVITTQIEHPAILEPCRFLERLGAEVTCLPVDRFGRIDPDDVRRAIRPETVLVSVMHANNEVGTLEPIAEVAQNRQLRDEIARLKGLPPRPMIRPSTLNAPHPDPSHRKKRRGKRPGSAKRRKTGELTIHETISLAPEGLPEETRQNGYEDFVVQDVKIEAHNVCYRRLRYLLPDGTSRTAPLPAHVQGHFGPGLRSYVLYQHHQNGVTQPLIHEELLDLGIDISTGQIDRLLTEGHDPFHAEKDALLPTAREVSRYFQADDTSARHLGPSGRSANWFP